MWFLMGFLLPFLGQTLAGKGCVVDLDSITGKYPPLLLQNKQFVYPTSEDADEHRRLKFDSGEKLELFCHGSTRYQISTYVKISGLPEEKNLQLTCSDGDFYSGETKVTVESATCNRRQEPRLVKSQEPCSPVGADGRTSELSDLYTVQIGWVIHDTFIEQVRLCIDEKVYGTLWTNHTVSAFIEHRDIDAGRPGFRIDNTYLKRFYTWGTSTKLTSYYSKNSQEETVENLLGHNTINGQEVIETSSSGTNYFAKGHLSPDAAFMYDVQQDATYYFMNAAPQFQSFNNGNWKALEGSTRDLAAKLARDISVYTGTFGTLTYADSNNNEVDIYLYNEDGKQYVPAPLYYWKVVHDPISDTSAAFIGLNDPHATVAPVELCPNRCAEMSWVDWTYTKLDSGYMYCCSVEEARKAIPSMPEIKTAGLIDLPTNVGGSGSGSGSCSTGPCTCSCNPAGDSYSCTCACDGQIVAMTSV